MDASSYFVKSCYTYTCMVLFLVEIILRGSNHGRQFSLASWVLIYLAWAFEKTSRTSRTPCRIFFTTTAPSTSSFVSTTTVPRQTQRLLSKRQSEKKSEKYFADSVPSNPSENLVLVSADANPSNREFVSKTTNCHTAVTPFPSLEFFKKQQSFGAPSIHPKIHNEAIFPVTTLSDGSCDTCSLVHSEFRHRCL